MVSLGEFSYDVTVKPQLGPLQQFEEAARRSRAAVEAPVRVNVAAAPAAAALANVGAAATAAAAVVQQPMTVKVNVAPAQSALQKFAGSVASGLGFGSGAAIAVTAIHGVTSAITGSIGAGLQYNATLETAAATFKLFTGSAEQADIALAKLRTYADLTPFSTEEVITAGQIFIKTVNGDIAAMEHLIHLTGQLAAVNPDKAQGGGFIGATVALRELNSGQTESIADRFNLSRSALQAAKDQGQTGVQLIETAIKLARGSEDLVTVLSGTFTGQLSNFQSALANLGAAGTKEFFDLLKVGLQAANVELTTNKDAWNAWAKGVGHAAAEAANEIVAFAKRSGDEINRVNAYLAEVQRRADQYGPKIGLGVLKTEAPQTPTQRAAAVPLAPGVHVDMTNAQYVEQQTEAQKTRIQDNTNALKQNAAAAEVVKNEYAKLLHPLEAELRAIHAVNQALVEQQAAAALVNAELAIAAQAAQAPVGIRADVAASTAQIDIDQRGLDIQTKRADLVQARGDAEVAVANDVANAQLAGAERALQGQQRAVAAAQQARQDEITGLQETQQVAATARADELAGIAEVTRARRDAYTEDLAGIREVQRAAEERWNNESRLADRAHAAASAAMQAQIAGLQEVNRVANLDTGPTAAERALARLDAGERRLQAARSLSAAKDAVGNARTGADRRTAQANLKELEHEQAVARRREQLEARIKAEKEAADKARLAREEQIRLLQVKAAADEKAYQLAKQAKDDAHALFLENQANENRAADKAEHDRERAEDIAARGLEKADRDAARADALSLSGVQKIDRDATRAEQAGIQAAEDAITNTRNAASDAAAGRQLAADQAHLERINQSEPLEIKRLDNAQKILDNENAAEIVRLAGAQVYANDTKTRLDNSAAILKAEQDIIGLVTVEKIDALKNAEQLRLDVITAQRDALLEQEQTYKRMTVASQNPIFGPGIPVDGQGPSLPLEGYKPPAAVAVADAGVASPDQGGGGMGTPNWVKLGQFAVDGLVSAFNQGKEALSAAVADWLNVGAITAAKAVLGIASPSTVFSDIGTDSAQGFIDGFTGLAVPLADAGRAPFEAVRDWLVPYFVGTMTTNGTAAGAAWRDAYNLVDLYAVGRKPLEDTLVWMQGLPDQFSGAGANAAAGFAGGFDGQHLGDHIYGEVRGALFDMANLYPSYEMLGRNLAVSMANGFQGAVDEWHAMNDPNGGGVSAGSVVGHAAGGFAPAGRVAFFGERGPEFGLPPQAGSVLPADISRNLLAAAAGRPVGGGASGGGNSYSLGGVSISIDGAGKSAHEIAAEIGPDLLEAFVNVLDASHRDQSQRLDRSQPGAD